MPYRMIRVFCAAPGNLESEVQAFQDAIGECNAAEAMRAGILFIPLSVSLKLKGQAVVDANTRTCEYYLLVLDQTWGSPGKSFAHDYRLARQCQADSALPMREVAVLLKESPADRIEPDLLDFRHCISQAESPRHYSFRDAGDFRAHVRKLLSEWLAAEPAAI